MGTRRVLFVVAACGVFYAVFARVALHAFPFSGDEYSYLLQAEIFARGRLRAPAPAHAELFGVDHVVIDQWVRSKYPPGTSALLALGVAARVPWLVTPLEGVVALILMWRAMRPLLGDRDAGVSLALLGAAPLFAFQAASFYSQTALTMWLAAAFAAVCAWTLDGRGWRLVLAGAATGCALMTRPLDAFVFGAALASLRSLRALGLAAVGAAPFVVLHFAYNWAQFGSPLSDGYHAYAPAFRAIYGAEAVSSISPMHLVDPEQLWHHLDVARAFLLDWTVPGTCLAALLGAFALRGDPQRARLRAFVLTWIALVGGSLLFTYAGYDDGARPRYLSAALLPMALLAGPGWRVGFSALAERVGPRWARAVAVVIAVLPPVQLGSFLVARTPEIWLREGLSKAVEARPIRDGVVIVRATYPTRYTRNGPFFDRPVLYVSAPAPGDVAGVAAAFPGKPIYEARQPLCGTRAGLPWTIQQVR